VLGDVAGQHRRRQHLHSGDHKALIGNTGFRRYRKTISEEHFAIDPDNLTTMLRLKRDEFRLNRFGIPKSGDF
jgi:hypothetical protein